MQVGETKRRSSNLSLPSTQNFRADVEIALRSGQMTNEMRKAFLSQVAGAIYTYKKYPILTELEKVSKQIVEIYPFLGLKNAKTGDVEVVSCLVYYNLDSITF